MKAYLTLGLLTLPWPARRQTGSSSSRPCRQARSSSSARARRARLHRQLRRAPLPGANPQFPLDQFIDGKGRAAGRQRQELKLLDLNGDKQPRTHRHRRGVPAAAAT